MLQVLLICVFIVKDGSSHTPKQDVVVHSKRQPLETIFKKPLIMSKAPRRLQRMMLQLKPFKSTVV